MGRPRSREHFVIDGGDVLYRKPYLHHGKYRTRKRDLREGTVREITLTADNLTNAKQEVLQLAEADREARKRAIAAGDAKPSPDRKVGPALDEWLSTLEARPATVETYRWDVELYKRALPTEALLRDLSYATVEKLFSKTWRKLSGRTKIKHRGMFVRFFKWGKKQGYCDENPAEALEIPKAWSREASRAAQTTGKALTFEEARKLLEVCRETSEVDRTPEAVREEGGAPRLTTQAAREDLWWFALISLRTGLRLSNIMGSKQKPGLSWGNVDLEKEELQIDGELMKSGMPFRVPLHAELVYHLKRRLRELRRVPGRDTPIVPGADRPDVQRGFARILDRAGLGDRGFRIHDLRHSFLSWIGEVCTHAVMRELAGHAAITVTDRYSHQRAEALREGLNKLCWLTREKTGGGGLDAVAGGR
jgi:integrase